jgi:hypothetical protein
MAHPNEHGAILQALAQYVVGKGTSDAEATYEVEGGNVLWVQRQGDGDQFHCAVLDTFESRAEMLKRCYEQLTAMAAPYSETELSDFETFHDVQLPPLLRYYLANISREVVAEADAERHTVQLCTNTKLTSAVFAPADLAAARISEADAAVLGGCLALDDSALAVLTGPAAGAVLIKAKEAGSGYDIITIWQAFYRPFA